MAGERENAENTGGRERPPASPRAYRKRLGSLTNVRAELADVYRQLRLGEIDQKTARTAVYTLCVLAGIIQGTQLEQRLADLEAKAREARR